MRCAIYTRFSSDLQRESSIDDQERRCRLYAQQQEWDVVQHYVIADRALSGAGVAGRKGIQDLIAAAKMKPRPFDRLLVDDTSRLARDTADSLNLVRTLQFYGVEVIAVANGIDTSQKSSKMAIMVHGIIDEQYLDGLSDKVHRGQEGRVLKSFNPGGRIYGYNNSPIEDPTRQGKYGRPAVLGVRLELIPDQAMVVRRIFGAYASGMSMDAIAGMLNAEGIPSPQPPKNRPSFGWCHTGIRAMLRNERYRGVFVWNKTKKARDPDSRKKVTKQRPPEEWVTQVIPEWRIVSDEQWAAVQERIRVVNANGIHQLGGQCRTENSRSYLFSGILRCGVCDTRLQILSGSGKRGYVKYGCPTHRKRAMCDNGLYIRQDRLENQLLSALERRIFQPDLLNTIIGKVQSQVAQRLHELEREGTLASIDGLKRKQQDLLAEAGNLAVAIGRAPNMDPLLKRLDDVEHERQTIEAQLATFRPVDLKVTEEQVRQHVTKNLLVLRSLLDADDVARTRAALQKHIPQLVLTPAMREGLPVYEVSGEMDLVGDADKCVMQVVARDGLEPPTPAFSGPLIDIANPFGLNVSY